MTRTERLLFFETQQRILEAIWKLQEAVASIGKQHGAFESTEEYLRLRNGAGGDELPYRVSGSIGKDGAGNGDLVPRLKRRLA